jgi:hypothetical protein
MAIADEVLVVAHAISHPIYLAATRRTDPGEFVYEYLDGVSAERIARIKLNVDHPQDSGR